MEPFRIEIPDAQLEDLKARLANTRWAERETVEDWSQGIPLAYLQELCEYWAAGYDWRATEARLNELPQFRTEIDGLAIHFIHVRSPHEHAFPLILTHGWPGSVTEFMKVIRPLAEPEDPADAFDLVIPSLPGYGFSDKPTRPGWGTKHIGGAWAELMARLGYERFGAHGGDWGSPITMHLAAQDPEHVAGIHLTMPVVPPRVFGELGELTESEQAVLARVVEYRRTGNGYSKQQSTRPQTLGYGLVDSPAGQCAWVVEKFHEWTDCDGEPENVLTKDEMLDDVMLYWLPAAATSSARLYWESFTDSDLPRVPVPAGCSSFPKEILRVPRRAVELWFDDLRQWREHDRGGHFAALEQPDAVVEDLRSLFRDLR
ncbi:MAG TPA: alpha/beta fold hydrolase [Solirubrobacteraceae bacterium]|jgi:pimeloyl-ACP methyl ester carboxylesterase